MSVQLVSVPNATERALKTVTLVNFRECVFIIIKYTIQCVFTIIKYTIQPALGREGTKHENSAEAVDELGLEGDMVISNESHFLPALERN